MLIVNDVQPSLSEERYGRGERIGKSRAAKRVTATVTAVFADTSVLLLRLDQYETLGDLAGALGACGACHGGPPLYVRATFQK